MHAFNQGYFCVNLMLSSAVIQHIEQQHALGIILLEIWYNHIIQTLRA